jgi:hypothetical protein
MKKVKQQKNEEGRDINRDLLEIEKCVFGSENDNYLVTKFECQSDETISPRHSRSVSCKEGRNWCSSKTRSKLKERRQSAIKASILAQ